MESPGVSDEEEFFDAFETTEQMRSSSSSAESQWFKFSDVLSHTGSEGNQSENSHNPFYDSTPRISLSDFSSPRISLSEYSTYNSTSHKEPDLLPNPSIRNIIKKQHKDFFEFAESEKIQVIDIDENIHNKIWILKFSPDGRFLAVGGENPDIKLYEVSKQRPYGPQNLFCEIPYNVMKGHNRMVLDISWARGSGFFLSAGEDWNVFIWGIGDSRPLLQFKHPEAVTCACFHPVNANYFLTGCNDKTIRVWNIPSYALISSTKTPELITAGAFTPNGDLILIGCLHGQVLMYEPCIEMNLLTQINCKNSWGRKKAGRKVTGFDFLDDEQVLIATNDSRMRLYNLKDFTLKQKYKGFVNEKFPLKPNFSHNLIHVISGSENGNIYLWNTYCTWAPKINPIFSRKKNFKNYSYEYFPVSKNKSFCSAAFAPDKIVKDVQNRNKRARSDSIVTHIMVVACEGKLQVFYNKFRIAGM
ncbi:unnamed protein product [Blepharisma stoltei]|uniref:Uncharacterized protein n=1 Tax=Blepharisma stoltei TaxID=1481888 RepID=A0AAU9IMD1_9CILI|nr:unnamed protein product [Blepharisma stoltei]